MKKKSLLLLIGFAFAFSVNSQNKKLTIRVTDENNKPVPGAIILFDNVRQKSWTNSNGIFKVKIKDFPKKITAFSPKIGIKTVNYKGQDVLSVKILEGNDKDFFLNKDANSIQGHASKHRTIYDYLRGQVPGVNVDGDNNITIRGVNSINANTSPLFIYNGIMISQDYFSQIVMADIKTVKVITGPEASKYGVRGANGVIEVVGK